MEYYVGPEVSLKQTSICVVDRSGFGRARGRRRWWSRTRSRSFFIASELMGPSSTGRRRRLLPSE